MNKTHIFENFDAEDWSGKDFRGHKFFHCHINHVKISKDTQLFGAEFNSCSTTYWEAENVEFDHFTALGCDFRSSNFQRTTWKKSRLVKCDFTWASFHGANLWDCSGEGSEFYLSQINRARTINPFDRDMISEIIRTTANGDVEILMVAGLVKSNKYLCWREFKTYASLPEWKRVGEIVFKVFDTHPSINFALAEQTMKEE